MNTLLELGEQLELNRDTQWMQAAHWAFWDVEQAAEARARLKRDRTPHLFPSPQEVRDLVAQGQSLKSGLKELNDRIDAMLRGGIDQEARANRTRGILIGAMAAGGSLMVLLALFLLWR